MSAASLFEAGRLSFHASSFETAIELFTQAIELSPAANYYDARASAYEKVGDLKSALLDAREVVRLLPESYKGYLRGGRLWKAAGKYDRAETILVEGKTKVSLRDLMVQREMDKEIEQVRTLLAKSRSSPFSTLPLEIFLAIIYLALPGPMDTYRHPIVMPSWADHTLSKARRVCRGWRNAIDTTPWLWHTLVMYQDSFKHDHSVVFPSWINKTFETDEEKVGGKEGIGLLHLVLTGKIDWAKWVVWQLRERGCIKRLASVTLDFKQSYLSDRDRSPIPRSLLNTTFLDTLAQACSTTLRRLKYETRDPHATGPYLDVNHWSTTFPHLQHLDMRAPRVPAPCPPTTIGSDVAITSPALRLTHLNLKYSESHVKTDSLHLLPLLSLPTLKHVNVSISWHIPFDSPPASEWSGRMLESMQELTLSSTLGSFLVDLAIEYGSTLPRLTTLRLDSTLLTSSRLDLFNSTNAPNLSHLDLRSTGRSQLRLVFPPMVKLTSLNLSATSWVDDAFIEDLVLKTPMLERINLSESRKLTGPPIMRLVRSRMPPPPLPSTTSSSALPPPPQPTPIYSRLVELNLKDCPGVDNASVDWLKKYVRPQGLTSNFSREKR